MADSNQEVANRSLGEGERMLSHKFRQGLWLNRDRDSSDGLLMMNSFIFLESA